MALLPPLLVLAWWTLTVSINYGGNWTALFCAGDRFRVPPELAWENVYQFPASFGYDGQAYHYIAHQPWPWSAMAKWLDAPALRYLRILLPGLAYVAVFGSQPWVDWAYRLIGLGFAILGAWWLGQLALASGRSPNWGLVFYASPAALIFIDRMTVDHVLCALVAGFAWAVIKGRRRLEQLAVALAPFARETGLVLAVAWAADRQEARARLVRLAQLLWPWLGWALLVIALHGFPSSGVRRLPGLSILHALANPSSYSLPAWQGVGLMCLDFLALAAACATIAGVLFYGIKHRGDPVARAALAFALIALVFQKDEAWLHVYNYGRLLSPALVCWIVSCWTQGCRSSIPLLLMTLLDLRVIMQWAPQWIGIWRALG